MGGSSKKKAIAWKIHVGQHLVLHLGVADKLLRVRWDERTAWEGELEEGGFSVDKPKLFGGDKKEGGVVGSFDFLPGKLTQTANSYLQGVLGALIPAYRGITSVVFRRPYLGLHGYLKKPDFRVQRIFKRHSDGIPQWYPAKAAINARSVSGVSLSEDFSAGLTPYTVTDGSIAAFSIVDDSHGKALVVDSVGNARDAISRTVSSVTQFIGFSCKCRITAAAVGDFGDMEFAGPDGSLGLNLGTYNVYDPPNPAKPRIITPAGSVYFTESLVLDVWHRVDVTFTGDGGVATLRRLDTGAVLASMAIPSGGDAFATIDTIRFVNKNFLPGTSNRWSDFQLLSLATSGDMNPAHILRECITDPDWGIGKGEAVPNEDSFSYAADVLYAEDFGLTTLWSRDTTVEEFAKEILRHIDGVMYRHRGQFYLKLARADYDPDTLQVLDENTVRRIENPRRPQIGEMINQVVVTTHDYDTDKDATDTLTDDAMVALQGRIISESIGYPAINTPALRRRVALRDLKARTTPLLACTVIATRAGPAAGLFPGGCFKLSWGPLGLSGVVMRAIKISPGDAAKSDVKIDAVEDVFSFPDAQLRGTTSAGWTNPTGDPVASPARAVFEAPYLELVRQMGQTQADAEIANVPEAGWLAVLAQQPSGYHINADLYVDAGGGYAEEASIDFAPVAVLAAALYPWETVATVVDASVFVDAALGDVFLLGTEFVRFDGYAGSAVTLGRGCLDTVPAPLHAAGTRLWEAAGYMDGDTTQYVEGETVAAKVLTNTGADQLALADAPADSATFAARAVRPYPPADVRLNGASFPASVSAPVTVTWVTRNRLQQTSGSLVDWFDATIAPEAGQTAVVELWDGATLVEAWSGETDGAVTLTVATSGTYTVRAYSQRAGHDSWTAFEHTLEILGGAERVSESGVARATEDGTLRGIE